MAMILLILFTISYFLHLTARVPMLGALHLDMVLGLSTLVAVFIREGVNALRLDQLTARRLNQFLLYVFISLPFVTWPGSVIKNNLDDWIKVALFFLLVVGAVRTEKQLRLLMVIFIGCQLFRTLEPLYMHITTGYWGDVAYTHIGGSMSGLNRLGGAPFDVVNSTQLGWVVVGIVPFLFYLLWNGNKWCKLLCVVLLIPSVKTLLLTGARSGLLSLGAVIFGIILLSERKMRNLVIVMVVVLPLTIMMIGQLSSDMQTRYLSLVESDVAGADTRQGRVTALIRQLGTISHNPLFGNGLGTSREVNWNIMGGSSQITHNLYIEILQGNGIIGFTMFMLFIAAMVNGLRQARQTLLSKGYGKDDWLWRLSSATLVWVIMDLFYSLSCFGLVSWEWYFFGGVATVCNALSSERQPRELAEDYHEDEAYAS
ncbi:MAG: O-antigen ligase family protein [Desulfuromonadaceae bacterium]|nr:O-antigen ligase family protein [Desulfuromonadaceae bacterium]MDD5104823.1 O-antigen ligase family protein [Desulfuromonadaceae bacterium]